MTQPPEYWPAWIVEYNRGQPRPYWPDETLVRWLNLVRHHGGPALEVGCGNGRNLAALLHAGYDPYGVDISPVALEQAEQRLTDYLDGMRPRQDKASVPGERIVGRLDKLPWPDGFFCLTVECNVLEHLEPNERKAAVAELYRVLKPGGDAFFRVNAVARYGRPLNNEAAVIQPDGVYIAWFPFMLLAKLLTKAGYRLASIELENKTFLGTAPRADSWICWMGKE